MPPTGCSTTTCATLQNFGELTWPQQQQVIINRPSFPDPYQGGSRDQFVSTAPPNISVMSNATVNPYAHQFDVGVNRVVMREYAVSVDWSYVNRYSDRDTVDPNLPIPNVDGGTRPYPQFNRVSFWQSTSDNSYRALLVKVEKRMSHRYQFLTSYTLLVRQGPGLHQRAGRSLRLLPGRSLRHRRPPPPSRRQRHRAAAVDGAALGDRRLPLEPAVRHLERARRHQP